MAASYFNINEKVKLRVRVWEGAVEKNVIEMNIPPASWVASDM